MSFDKTFCPGPWFHMRITNPGKYEYCRWATPYQPGPLDSIKHKSPIYWFQYGMSGIRKDMLDGKPIAGCQDCYQMEQHGKISGRQRQLLKAGIDTENFDKTFLSSPWLETFKDSQQRKGDTDVTPQDWQVDLGNYCNSACIFCSPEFSSKIAVEYKRIGISNEMPTSNWCEEYLNSFLDTLSQSENIAYLHFIGGETLITPAFKQILKALISSKLNNKVSIGFTVNLTVWDQEIVDLLHEFREINLGMSVECFHPVNDYVRYGSKLATVQKILDQWIDFGTQHSNCLMQLRTTPTLLSIKHLLSVYDVAWEKGLNVESCNFLSNPQSMRPTVLPMEYRKDIIQSMQDWLAKHPVEPGETLTNTRHPLHTRRQIVHDLTSYVDYLSSQQEESHLLPELANFLMLLESSRNNCILDYLPEYEKLFKDSGYKPNR